MWWICHLIPSNCRKHHPNLYRSNFHLLWECIELFFFTNLGVHWYTFSSDTVWILGFDFFFTTFFFSFLCCHYLLSLVFLGGLSFNLNHLIASCMTNYEWPFGILYFGLFWSNLDTRDLETYPRTYYGHFWNMSLFDDSRAIWILFRKWVVSENQSFLDEWAIITPLSV